MPKRRRWKPVKGEANRVYDPLERALLGAADTALRVGFGAARLFSRGDAQPAQHPPREVLVLRLDRIGDLVMSLPALAELRAALPNARIRLAVGRWNAEIAKSAPVDELLVWSAPWVGRQDEGAESLASLLAKAAALRKDALDIALDLQGDVRASLLLWRTQARRRVGYANTGGRYLLTDVVPLDETVSWTEQNRRAVAVALGTTLSDTAPRVDPLTDDERAFAARLIETLALTNRRPLVGIHPSGGRRIKEWPVARWREVAAGLQKQFGATILITGTGADQALARELQQGLPARAIDLTGKLSLRETLALLAKLDLFLSADTGTMHMACAVGTPSVSVFGPSDPVRYFSGGGGLSGARHVVVRAELWCAPCNLIRKPPAECAQADVPECLQLVGVDAVYREAAHTLSEHSGFGERPTA